MQSRYGGLMLAYGGMFLATLFLLLVLSFPVGLALGLAVATVNLISTKVTFEVSEIAIATISVISLVLCVGLVFVFTIADQKFGLWVANS